MKKPPVDENERHKRWKFGQNFLIDEGVIRQITDDVPCGPGDWVVEIGPGQGALTRRLAARCGRISVLEIDPKWVEHLEKKTDWGNLQVIRADATRVDVEELLAIQAPAPGAKPLVVGNLPYNRAAPILFRFVPFIGRFRSMHIMVQYEVAKRISAKPHTRDFGFLSVFIQNYATAELRLKISPEAFRPRPKVLSATVALTARTAPLTTDPLFLPFVKQAFSQKRKKLTNSLMPFYPRLQVVSALDAQGINPDSRAEDLSVENFVALFARLGPPVLAGGTLGGEGTGSGTETIDSLEDPLAPTGESPGG